MGKVIGVMSFKGGVGKSITTINLAAGLEKLGNRVLVVDGNFLSPNLHLYLGLLKPEKTLKEIIREDVSPENAIYQHKFGIDLLPCNFYKDVNLTKLASIIENLKKKYDYIVFDSGPSYTEEVIAILTVCDELIFVATPDYTTLAATVRISKFTKFKNVKILGLVLNRVRRKNFEVSRKDIEKTVGIKVIAEIREDVNVMRASKAFRPVIGMRWSSSGKAFLKLARKIAS